MAISLLLMEEGNCFLNISRCGEGDQIQKLQLCYSICCVLSQLFMLNQYSTNGELKKTLLT